MMARASATNLESGQLEQMDQQGLIAMLAHAESITARIRQLLGAAAPAQKQSTPADAPAEAAEVSAPVPSLTNSQSPEPDTDISATADVETSAVDADAAKSPASPATTDDVPPMTQGEKTPVQGDQSPAAPLPLPLEEDGPIESAGVPATPTKAAAITRDEPVVLEAGGEGEKALGEGPDDAPIEI
jgi:hypothetical protein